MALIERIENTPDATNWPGKIPLNYIYTAGRAQEVFFSRIRDAGRFTGARCTKCGTVYLPARIFCERCFERIEGNWVNLPNRGLVETFTVCHETYDEQPKDPTIVAFIGMEGSDGGLMHWLSGVEPEDVYIGMPVKAVFKPKGKRKGGILDIEHFVPTR